MPERRQILITDRFSQDALLTLQAQSFFEVRKAPTPVADDLDLAEVNGLIIRSRTRIDEKVLARAKKLQVIVTATSGFDHIDLEACQKWGVTVMFTPNANIESAAQLTWGLVLACASKVSMAHREIRGGAWKRDHLVGTELFGKTYGIVGLGRIGSKVAEIGQAFGMNVCAYDPYIEDQVFRQLDVERLSYEELLKQSDILSFHVPKTRETTKMLSRSHFEYIQRGIVLVNTSRGSVIDELDLVQALEQGWVAAAGLDVFEKEPLPRTSKLLNFPQVVLTPHLGAHTSEAFAKASETAALRVIEFFMAGQTRDTLPPKAPWYGAVSPWNESSE